MHFRLLFQSSFNQEEINQRTNTMSQSNDVYLQCSPSVAFTVLSQILTSSGFPIDEPDPRKIAKVLSPAKALPPVAMVSIPLDDDVVEKEHYRERTPEVAEASISDQISHEQVPGSLQFASGGAGGPTTSTPLPRIPQLINLSMEHFNFNEVELALMEECSVIDEENMELSYLRQTLSLSMLEAEFLRMQLRMFNLKARSILELFQYCDGSNAGFCRCPEIRKRIFEMGILVQRQ
ncbi:uncharacterized protein LOC109622412 [Aedes albopictus]|uniref:Uncharacterized protein n=1 Tax=Aedes albopictus TaxID=7160 RepID=A0ABM1YWU3_AEDAL